MNIDPNNKKEDQNDHLKKTGLDQEKHEDNSIQDGLTGESEEEEDVSGDLAGNAAGNPED